MGLVLPGALLGGGPGMIIPRPLGARGRAMGSESCQEEVEGELATVAVPQREPRGAGAGRP